MTENPVELIVVASQDEVQAAKVLENLKELEKLIHRLWRRGRGYLT